MGENVHYLTLPELEDLNLKGELVGLHDVEEQAYHDGPALSRSDINSSSRSAYHFDNKQPMKESPALTFGKAFHTLILEPQFFDDRFKVVEKVDRRTKDGKVIVQEALDGGYDLLLMTDYDRMNKMRDKLFENPYVKEMFSEGRAETAAYAIDKKTGLLCKAKADWINGSVLIDLKTTMDASLQAFRKDMVKYSYDLQAAHYLETFNSASSLVFDKFIFVCVEKEAPHGVAIYLVNDSAIETGKDIRQRLLSRIKSYYDAGSPDVSYPQEIQMIDLAAYGYDVSSRIGD